MDEVKSTAIRVVMVDDHTILRQGLRKLLESTEGIEVVGEAGSGEEGIQVCATQKPDVCILDLSLPNLSGIDVMRQMKQNWPEMSILVLTVHASREFIREAMRAGASAYVLKDSPSEELVKAIHAARSGHAYVCPAVSKIMLSDYVDALSRPISEDPMPFTAREEQIMRLVVQGYSNQQVADLLHLSTRTVDSHRYRIMKKLNLRSVQELVLYAVKKGYVKVEPEADAARRL